MSETELPAYLMSLAPEQLQKAREMLLQRIEQQQEKKLEQRRLPPLSTTWTPSPPTPGWICPASGVRSNAASDPGRLCYPRQPL